MAELIKIEDMCKIYNPGENEVRALDHVSLTINRREFVAIIGQSGSGKSTLMNMLGCLDVPTSGTYILDGKDVSTLTDDEQSDINTRKMLIQIIRIARHILNEGLPLRLLIDLGLMIKDKDSKVDYSTLAEWLRKLRFQQMAQLEGALLIELFGFETIDIPFAQGDVDKKTAIVAKELAEYTNVHKDFYFSQSPDSIFVHTSNSGALISHIKRSARYMRFIPSEALTNFFASFAHSLTHIEE